MKKIMFSVIIFSFLLTGCVGERDMQYEQLKRQAGYLCSQLDDLSLAVSSQNDKLKQLTLTAQTEPSHTVISFEQLKVLFKNKYFSDSPLDFIADGHNLILSNLDSEPVTVTETDAYDLMARMYFMYREFTGYERYYLSDAEVSFGVRLKESDGTVTDAFVLTVPTNLMESTKDMNFTSWALVLMLRCSSEWIGLEDINFDFSTVNAINRIVKDYETNGDFQTNVIA